MTWVQDLFNPKRRSWEDFYRNRFQHDKVVRSTHGVNCTGGCSWSVYVKDGLVAWEEQCTDYPKLAGDIPGYEPRGCQRGISFSWYIYSPLRVKYPYIRGVLVDLWDKARESHSDPVEAWASIMEDPASRKKICEARGKGGFRRVSWDAVLEIIAAASIYTIKKYGPDRVLGFSPIPAMSMLSYAAGSRMLQLMGGTVLSFYDWYSDLPPASPEIWGEQTDVAESADWYNSKFIAVVGSNVGMTRTPDVHYLAEARYAGAKVVMFSPDYSQSSKYSDWWVPVNAGQDASFWMAVNHVILKEFYADREVPYFTGYLKQYTDNPFLIELQETDGHYKPGRLVRAASLSKYKDVENGEWKFLMYDKLSGSPKMPKGTMGYRWQKEKGQWNLELKDGLDGSEIAPALTFIEHPDDILQVVFEEHAEEKKFLRGVPVKYIETQKGRVPVATVFDLVMGQFGVGRGLAGDYPENYEGPEFSYTPAWQEKFSGIDRKTVIEFARQWASTAEKTQGKCSVIIGSGVNHWYHNNIIYRSAITALMLCGCVGRNGGGLNHYVGQEKVAPLSVWTPIAMALDWVKPPRLQNSPSFHYVHSDQWRYEASLNKGDENNENLTELHTMDMQVKAVKMGWLPFYPSLNRNPIDIVKDAEADGAKGSPEVAKWVVEKLKSGDLKFAVEEPDAPANWPRLWFIWRGNALSSSGKGHEYILKHYLGTHNNLIADELAEGSVRNAKWEPEAPAGKLDLIVDINFRMDTSALYSDIVLPTATWYEKDDLNSTDLHSFIHPLSEAVKPCWESRSDWEIFKAVSKKISELAEVHLPGPVRELVMMPLLHDTPAELAQPEIKDWTKGECEAIPGKTMPSFTVVERDYPNLYNKFISLGPGIKKDGIGAHGLTWPVDDLYDELIAHNPTVHWDGETYPSISDAARAADVILHLAPETNGESAYRAWVAEEAKVGLPLRDLGEGDRGQRVTFDDLKSQPRRVLTTPVWSGDVRNGRAYSAYVNNVERLIPWRTLTGRQHFYLDHEAYIAWGENLPTYKIKPGPGFYGDIVKTRPEGKSVLLNYLTPHSKWTIHSTYYDNLKMLTLSRGMMPIWVGVKAADELGIVDNDWVEAYNDHGVVVARAVVSARIPDGLCMLYHAPERTISTPKSPLRGYRRAGGHNSLTRARLKPLLMVGGYGQFTYAFNYWGPTGVNRDTYIYIRKLPGDPSW